MLTVREDERQAVVGLRAAYHGFVAMFLAALAIGIVALYVLNDDSLAAGSIGVLMIGVVAHQVSLWRGGWFAYVREVNVNPADRARSWRQAVIMMTILTVSIFLYYYALADKPFSRAAMGTLAGMLAVAALVWWAYFRKPDEMDGER